MKKHRNKNSNSLPSSTPPPPAPSHTKSQAIGWFPGHMKRTTKLIETHLKGTNIIIEVIDARVPFSSRSSLVWQLTKTHPRIIILNKADLADEVETKKWKHYFKEQKQYALTTNSKMNPNSKKVKELIDLIHHTLKLIQPDKKPPQNIKALITGVPNVGKSSYINFLCGKNKTRVENRPGVTKSEQIIQVTPELMLMDLPGLLDTKLTTERGYLLALLGFIKDEIIDFGDVGLWLCQWMMEQQKEVKSEVKREVIPENYQSLLDSASAMDLFLAIAQKKGCMFKGSEVNLEKAGFMMAKEIRAGKWGRITWERVEKS